MAIQYIINYLRKNKDKFSFEVLKEKLLKAGYPEHLIEEAAREVYEPTAPPVISRPTSFWDFRHKKIYTSGGEKILDFITGFTLVVIVSNILGGLLLSFSHHFYISLSRVIFPFTYLILIIYFLTKRKYIAFGIIFEIFLSLLFSSFYLFRYLL